LETKLTTAEQGKAGQLVIEAADRLAAEGREDGRVLVLNLHPWLMGQAFRATYLQEVLAALTHRSDIWISTGDEVTAHWASQQNARSVSSAVE